MALAGLMTACNSKPSSQPTDQAIAEDTVLVEENNVVESKLETNRLNWNDSTKHYKVSLQYDAPKESALKDSIEEDFRRLFANEDIKEGKDLRETYENTKRFVASAEHFGDESSSSIEMSSDIEWQDENYVTYIFSKDFYLAGCAHGSFEMYGVTYEKSTGKRFGWDKINKSAEFQSMVMNSLKEYFKVSTDDELYESLFPTENDKLSEVKLPKSYPYMTARDSFCIQYQQYEICGYAAGLPYGTISKKSMDKYLNEEGKAFWSKY